MKCQKCGAEHDGEFCPSCGTPSMSPMPQQPPMYATQAPSATLAPSKTKKKLSTKQIVLIVAGIFIIGAVGGVIAFATMGADIKAAQAHIAAGEYEQAKELLDKQISTNGTFEKVYIAYSDYYLAQKDYLSAVDILEKGVNRCNPNDAVKKRLESVGNDYSSEIASIKEQQEKAEKEAAEAAAKEEQERQNKEKEEQQKSKEDYISSCQAIAFSDLARNPDKYKGQQFKFIGEVIQVVEPTFGNAVVLRVNVTQTEYGFYTDTIYATVSIPDGADRILNGDIITIYGDCDGIYSYTSVLNQKISLPKIRIKYYSAAK